MKKSLLLVVLMVFGWVGVAGAISYQFEDLIEPNMLITEFGLNYTHDITDDVDFSNGDFVSSATLELDFTNDRNDSYGWASVGWFSFYYDNREYASYGFDGSTFTLLGEVNNGQHDIVIDIDWLNDDGYLDVSLSVHNNAYTAWATLDHSRLYGTAETAPVPEPSTWILLGSGLAGLALYRRKRNS